MGLASDVRDPDAPLPGLASAYMQGAPGTNGETSKSSEALGETRGKTSPRPLALYRDSPSEARTSQIPYQPARHPQVPIRKQEVGTPGHGEPGEESNSRTLGPPKLAARVPFLHRL